MTDDMLYRLMVVSLLVAIVWLMMILIDQLATLRIPIVRVVPGAGRVEPEAVHVAGEG